ncbi:MAG: hypothetical protein ACREO5_00880 [Candidatus Binatia bacterium]
MGALSFPTIDQAISTFEGFGTSAAPTITNANNPGAIQAGPFATSQGATGATPGGFAIFPDQTTGLHAVDALVSRYANEGATFQDLISHWSPANAPGNSPAATQNYTNYVAQQAGATPNTPVSSTQAPNPGSQFNPFNWDWSTGLAAIGNSNAGMPVVKANAPPGTSNCGTFDILCLLQSHGVTLGRVVAIVLGLLLIGAALFSFGLTSFEGSPTLQTAAKAAVV